MTEETVNTEIPIETVARVDKALMGIGTPDRVIKTTSLRDKIDMLVEAVQTEAEEMPESLDCEECGSNAWLFKIERMRERE